MYEILKYEILTDNIFLMDVKAERIAKSCLPGQFVIVRSDADGERIPLTICDYSREEGTVTIVFQIVGAGTQRLSELKAGDYLQDIVGPLGRPSELTELPKDELAKKKILFVWNIQPAAWRLLLFLYNWTNIPVFQVEPE